jgi:hypothetical protein
MDQYACKPVGVPGKGTRIPRCSTPVKNTILVDIFARGLLKYNEIRIVAYIIRYSWGFAGKTRRQDWTKSLSHRKIAAGIGMARQTVSTNVKSMVERGILMRKEGRYQFNEHYDQWVSLRKSKVNNLDGHKQLQTMSENVTKKVNDIDIQHGSNSMQTTDCGSPKETSKDTINKETDSIVKLWNYLATRRTPEYRVGLIEARHVAESLRSKIKTLLTAYGVRGIKVAVFNYHKFLTMSCLRKTWEGYRWTLGQFLDPDKGHIDKYTDWRVVESNYLRPCEWHDLH